MTVTDPVPVSVESTLPDLAHLVLDNPSTAPSPATSPAPEGKAPHVYPDGPKNSPPFHFGSRLLLTPSDVYTHNAWDHVTPTTNYQRHTRIQLATQRAKPVSDFDKKRFNTDPAKWWDLFYKNNKENFFKDRKWLQQEFPILASATRGPEAGEVRMVELGCGAGNTLFPVLRANRNPRFHIHGADFSAKAVEIVKGCELFREEEKKGTVSASVYDLSSDALPEGVEEGSVDVVIMVFVFSALAPEQWSRAVRNVARMLKKGGRVLFRDYGRGDLAQVRFKTGRYLEENFYVRGDGTRVYFFEVWELRQIFTGVAERGEGEVERWGGRKEGEGRQEGEEGKQEDGEGKQEETAQEEIQEEEDEDEEDDLSPEEQEKALQEEMARFPEGDFGGFITKETGVDRRLIVNRKRQIKMYRCWMQAVFEKV